MENLHVTGVRPLICHHAVVLNVTGGGESLRDCWHKLGTDVWSQEVDFYVLTAKTRPAYTTMPTLLRRLFMGAITVYWLVSWL